MKICTLVVRILGIFLLFQSVIALIEANRMSDMSAKLLGTSVSLSGLIPEGAVTRLNIYAGIGAIVGLICTLFAARVARWLTFDEHEK